MFSGPVLVVLFVPTQQMFSGSVVHPVFCEERTTGTGHFCSPGFGDMSELFLGPVRTQRLLLCSVSGSMVMYVDFLQLNENTSLWTEIVCVNAYVCDPDALVSRGFVEESRPPHSPPSLCLPEHGRLFL